MVRHFIKSEWSPPGFLGRLWMARRAGWEIWAILLSLLSLKKTPFIASPVREQHARLHPMPGVPYNGDVAALLR